MGDKTGPMGWDQVTQSLQLKAEKAGLGAVGHAGSWNSDFSMETPLLVFLAQVQYTSIIAGREPSSFKPSPFTWQMRKLRERLPQGHTADSQCGTLF